ncbi:unnamed protein product [Dibothriocephalus latus]|uniref:Reverse transcriptase domain-containing protein n=1 Tax=Dibothriocephalus latus TaxID=60516 RepID=A0A3P6UB77_DIBLA|nr:unnamed protein product [Dibothriocephalus latus]
MPQSCTLARQRIARLHAWTLSLAAVILAAMPHFGTRRSSGMTCAPRSSFFLISSSVSTRETELTATNFSSEEIPTTDSVDLTEFTVLKELLKLKETKSPSPDGIPAKLLKELAGFRSWPYPLPYIYRRLCAKIRCPDIIFLSSPPEEEEGASSGTRLYFIDDCISGFDCEFIMFADDLKRWKVMRKEEDEGNLQANLHRLEQRSTELLLPFNVDKCKIMRFRRTSTSHRKVYHVNRTPLPEVEAQKDLDI